MMLFPDMGIIKRAELVDRVIHQVHIEAAVEVVIKKNGLGGKSGKIETVFGGFLFEKWNAVFIISGIDEKLVMSVKSR
jgi:hypothetical protein